MSLAEGAFKETLSEIERLKADDIVSINVDIPTTVSIALGADGLIAPLVPEMKRELPKTSIHHLHGARGGGRTSGAPECPEPPQHAIASSM